MDKPRQIQDFLASDEPKAYYLENTKAPSNVFITCDHASNKIPKCLDNLGLQDAELDKHIAYDIGALNISKKLSQLFDAPLLYSSYSRLVVDLNRQLHDVSSMPEISDNIYIPGNQNLSVEEKQQRINHLFWPYHQRFSHVLDNFNARMVVPLIVGVHTFTPLWQNHKRPWHIGVMWDTDDRIAQPFLKYLDSLGSYCVGDNRPYHAVDPEGVDPIGYAFEVHARSRGIPHIFIEVRQNLVNDQHGAEKWANIIYNGLLEISQSEQLMYVQTG